MFSPFIFWPWFAGLIFLIGGLLVLLAIRNLFSFSPLVISFHVVAFLLFLWARVAAHWSWSTGWWGGLVLASAVVRIICEEVAVTGRYPEYVQ